MVHFIHGQTSTKYTNLGFFRHPYPTLTNIKDLLTSSQFPTQIQLCLHSPIHSQYPESERTEVESSEESSETFVKNKSFFPKMKKNATRSDSGWAPRVTSYNGLNRSRFWGALTILRRSRGLLPPLSSTRPLEMYKKVTCRIRRAIRKTRPLH